MRGRILAIGGCVAAMGVFFPVWNKLIQWEEEGKGKEGIYTQIRDLESQIKAAEERIEAGETTETTYTEKLKPYEEILGRVSAVKDMDTKDLDWNLSDGNMVFLKVPFMLDVEGLQKSYEGTKGSVAFNTTVGGLGGALWEWFGNVVNEGAEDFAEEEAAVRVELAAELYNLVDQAGRSAEAALVDYWTLADYKSILFQNEEEGPLISSVMIAEQLGGRTEEEENRLSEVKTEAIDALAKLDFVLNVYYDLSRDSMIDSQENNNLLNNGLMKTRNIVSALLKEEDVSSHGYSKEEKWSIVKPLLEKWKMLIDQCYVNGSEEFSYGYVTLQTGVTWLDLNFQVRNNGQTKLPKRLNPHWANGKLPMYIYYSNDTESRHKAYYVNKYDTETWYYETDRGEVFMESEAGEENAEVYLTNADQVWDAAMSGENNWQGKAVSYLK